jgi:ribosomal protein S18 acetylase RimI-like enzyme
MSKRMQVEFEENVLTATQFLTLRESIGWTGKLHQIEKAIEKGLYNIIAKDEGRIIGMGRLVGDGIMYWYMQDVIILPQYQGKGIGKQMVERMLQYIQQNSMSGTTATVGLMAAQGKEPFYEKWDFIIRPNEKMGAGMIKHIIC